MPNFTTNNLKQKEIWKAIPGFAGYYEVSNLGRVKSLQRVVPHKLKGKKTINEKILSNKPGYAGYDHVVLWKNHIPLRKRVHELVLLVFVGPKSKGEEAMHMERVKGGYDNSLSNLRYGSHTCNLAFKYDDGTDNVGSKHPCAKLTESKVIKIKKIIAGGKHTSKEIGRMFSVSRQTISHIKNNRTWTHVTK